MEIFKTPNKAGEPMNFKMETKIDIRALDEKLEQKLIDMVGDEYVSLDHELAQEIAVENLKTQAADDYFDGVIILNINGKPFHNSWFHTTALIMTWTGLINFKDNEESGESSIILLDEPEDLYILFEEDGYRFKTYNREYEIADDGFTVTDIKRMEAISDLIPKDIFETEIARACEEFLLFCEMKKLPVNQEELAYLRESWEKFAGKK